MIKMNATSTKGVKLLFAQVRIGFKNASNMHNVSVW